MKPILPLFTLAILCTHLLFSQNVLDNAGLTAGTPASVAFSLRKLSSSYTGPAIKVRRSSDLSSVMAPGLYFLEIIAPGGNKQTITMRIY